MEGKTVIAIAHRPPHRGDGQLIVLDEAGWWRRRSPRACWQPVELLTAGMERTRAAGFWPSRPDGIRPIRLKAEDSKSMLIWGRDRSWRWIWPQAFKTPQKAFLSIKPQPLFYMRQHAIEWQNPH
jgi:hypothetical protein